MGNTEGDDEVDGRRAFVRRLRGEPEVRRVSFSRDGFRTIVVGLERDADFRDRWRRTAADLGYTVERVTPEESRPDRSGNVWVLELTSSEEPTDESRLLATLRRLGGRVRRTIRDRLPGRDR